MPNDARGGASAAPRALEGLRVLDLGHWLAGPFGPTLLGDFGADVIKVEPPTSRKTPTSTRISWAQDQRNKRSISLALNHPRGSEVFKELVKHVDVVVENFAPGTMEKFGLGYEILAEMNPRVILSRVSAFGQYGPYRDRPGFDRLGMAMGGLTYTTGFPDAPPVRPGYSLADYTAGLFNAYAILAAVHSRDVVGTGLGQEIDVSLYESVFRLSGVILAQYAHDGIVRERTGNIVPGISPGDQFETADGKWIVFAGAADHHFRTLFEAVGLGHVANAPEFATVEQRRFVLNELNDMIRPWFLERTCEEAMSHLDQYHLPVTPVFNAADIDTDPHYAARGSIVVVDDPELGPLKQPAPTPKLSKTPGQVYSTAPFHGMHNEEIYCDLLGFTTEQLHELSEAGVI